MTKRVFVLLVVFAAALPSFSSGEDSNDRPLEIFVERVGAGHVRFAGIDPEDIGNPQAFPRDLAQLDDPDGEFGSAERKGGPKGNFWTFLGKSLVVIGVTGAGAGIGAAIGSAAPGLGTAAGAVVGGVFGFLSSLDDAIDRNKASRTQDVLIFDKIAIEPQFGKPAVDLKSLIVDAVIADVEAGGWQQTLPGGGLLIVPGPSLFAGSGVMKEAGGSVNLAGAKVDLGVLDTDGSLETTTDRTVLVVFQDFTPVQPALLDQTAQVLVKLDAIVDPTLFEDGAKVSSRHIFGQTFPSGAVVAVPTLSTYALVVMVVTLLVVGMGMARKSLPA